MAETEDVWLSFLVEAGFKDMVSSVNLMGWWRQIRADFELQNSGSVSGFGADSLIYTCVKQNTGNESTALHGRPVHIPRRFNRYYGYGLYIGRK